jgi:hypothetical protein
MGILHLWLPILVSAIVVFAMSALVWTVLPWHKKDYRKCTNEDAVSNALKGSATGAYVLPHVADPAEFRNDAVRQRYADGPNAFITVVANGLPKMGPKLAMSFLLNLLVGIVCAYLLSRMMNPEAPYLEVFRLTGTTAFVAYGMGYFQESIWFGRPWSLTLKNLFDAFLYGLLTGGVFGWLYI